MLPHPVLLFLLAVLLGSSCWVEAEQSLLNHRYPRSGNTSVQVVAVIAPIAKSGALPYRVTIQNDTDKDRTWFVELSDGRGGPGNYSQTSIKIEVPSRSESTHEMELAVLSDFSGYSSRTIKVRVNSPGLEPLDQSQWYQHNGTLPLIGMSRRLARRSLTQLQEAAEKRDSSDQRFAELFTPSNLPTSWSSLSGLEVMMIDLESWQGLQSPQRKAIVEWMRLGGSVSFYLTPEERETFTYEDLEIRGLEGQAKLNQKLNVSMGSITARTWDGTEIPGQALNQHAGLPRPTDKLASDFGSDWKLSKDLGNRKFHSLPIFLLLFAFAVLIAPVNLFYFAKPGRRHRLFWTTPLISVAACAIIVAIIFISDGLGGRGYRLILADLQSAEGERRLYLTQEQISRTGVILRSGFDSPKRPMVELVALDGTTMGGYRSRVRSDHQFAGEKYSGDFFRSRSDQGYQLRVAEPTRARITGREAQGNGIPPDLRSELPGAIRDVFYVDSERRFWRQSQPDQAIAPGEVIPFKQTDEATFRKWVNEKTKPFSSYRRNRIRALMSDSGRFFATAADSSPFTIETHPRIDWENDVVLLTGDVLREDLPSATVEHANE